jgi:putative SOS response-associated peptidase YedK
VLTAPTTKQSFRQFDEFEIEGEVPCHGVREDHAAGIAAGFPPSGPRGGPVFNFRSEGRSFDKSNRGLNPASAFFEFTGKKYPKAKRRFMLHDAAFMAIAGI